MTTLVLPKPPERGIFLRDPPIVDDEGRVLQGGMWPSQRIWWDLPNFVRLFVGGYGSGKTLELCKRHIELALVNAPIPTAIVSPTYPMAQETVIATLIELLNAQEKVQRMRGGKLTYTHRKSVPIQFEIKYKSPMLPNGKRYRCTGRILIYSGEDPRKLKGPNLSSAGIDEPFIQPYEVFEQMVVRVRHRDAKKAEVNLTGTPEQLNWGYDLAEGELRDKYDVGIVQASTLENKALKKGYVERLLGALDPKAAQAYVHGLFVNMAKGLVYYSFDRMENVVELEMPIGAELGCGMDFNVNPMAATVFWMLRSGTTVKHIHYIDEIELSNSDTQAMCSELHERYSLTGYVKPYCAPTQTVFIRSGLREIYPDSNAGRHTNSPGGKTDYDYIREGGFEVNKHVSGNPPPRDRYNATNNMLRPSSGRVRVTISPRCKKLIKYLSLYTHEGMKTETMKAMSHLLDAKTYPIAYLCPSDRDSLKLLRVRGT